MDLKEWIRDKTRDELVETLNSLGVKAEIAERGRIEEKVENTWYRRSLGAIDIPNGSISWINILKKDGSQHSPPSWWVVLGIPDDKRDPASHIAKIKTVRKKSFPLLGRVIDVIWEGDDAGTGLVDMLSKDPAVETLVQRVGNLEIKRQVGRFQGWTLTLDRRFNPTHGDWRTIERISDCILESPWVS